MSIFEYSVIIRDVLVSDEKVFIDDHLVASFTALHNQTTLHYLSLQERRRHRS